MQLSSSIIDNLDNNIGDVIKANLSKSQQVQFAVGFLFLSGLKDIFPQLQTQKSIQLLIGTRTSKQTASILGEAFEQKYQTPHEIEQEKEEAKGHYAHDIGTECTQNQKDKDFLLGLYDIVKSGKLKIKIYTKATLHAKAYIFTARGDSIAKGRCIIGSSNLSKSGFYDNTELNVIVDGDENYDKMQAWFQRLRDSSEDFAKELLETIDSSRIKAEPTPYEVYMKILYEMIGHYLENNISMEYEWTKILYQFQIDAVKQAVDTIKKYGGVFVCDVVGLGKTYTGSVIMDVLTKESHTRGLMIVPAKLIKDRQSAIRKFSVNAEVVSIDGLHKVINNKSYDNIQYVLVDESHKFKSPGTNRYPLLQEFIQRTDKKLVLLSATPLNLDGRDVYHQIKLFHKGEEIQLPITPSNLYQFFQKYEKGEVDLGNVLGELMVRRTRLHIKKSYKKDMARMDKGFPERQGPYTIQYDLNQYYQGLYDEIEGILGQRTNGLSIKQRKKLLQGLSVKEIEQFQGKLKYAMYFKTQYIKDSCFIYDDAGNKKLDDPEFDDLLGIGENLKELAKITFYQRLESSPIAFINTLDRIIKYNEIYLSNLKNGYIFKTKHSADLEEYRGVFDDMDESEEEDFLSFDEGSYYDIKKFDVERYIADMQEDTTLLQGLRKKAAGLLESTDMKSDELTKCIEQHIGKKILVFSQYSDTTQYLKEKFITTFPHKVIEEMSGNSKDNITNILGRFSPVAQDYKLGKNEKEIDILFATDMIAEGQNLQDAEVVINYDLHRNPVKLIQRIGRIDRIGSTNDKIYIYNFYPSTTGEGRLGLRSKVAERVNAIHKHIGEENKIVSQKEQLNQEMLTLYEQMLLNQQDTMDQIEEVQDKASNIFVYSQLIKELQDCKEQHPTIFQKIKKMPLRMRAAQKGDETTFITYCKYGEFDHCYILRHDGSIENNKAQFLQLAVAQPDTPMAKLPTDHDEKTMQIEQQFHEDVKNKPTEEIFAGESRTSMDMKAFANKLRKYQDEYVDKYEHEEHDMIDELVGFFESGLETRQKRQFKSYKKIRRVSDFSTTTIVEMYNLLQQIIPKQKEKVINEETNREKYIVMSESIV